MENLVTFHPFPRLPTELRLKIWRLAQPERGIIRVEMIIFIKEEGLNEDSYKEKRHLLISGWKVPSPFRVCLESRVTYQAVYTHGFKADGLEDLICIHSPKVDKRGRTIRLPRREMYWRPKVDVVQFTQEPLNDISHDRRLWNTTAGDDFDAEGPWGGLHAYGIQHVILPVAFFSREEWDPRLCGYTWGMETVYIVLKREMDDTVEGWEKHLAWFGRWWLKVTRDWRDTVGDDTPLEQRVPFLPKAIGCFGGEVLQSRHLEEASDCVLVDQDELELSAVLDDEMFQVERYGCPSRW